MNIKRLKVPGIIIAIGLVFTLAACLFSNILRTPAVTEHSFNYSVTYKLCGEIKTLEGVYKCSFDGYRPGDDPNDRYYTGEYIVAGQSTSSHSYVIAEKDGAQLYIVTVLDACYLMNDTQSLEYEGFLEDPYLEAVDSEGCTYDEAEMPAEFTAEIIRWEYPEPIENDFVFDGLSLLHAGSMLAMLAVGALTVIACLIFVKRDQTVSRKPLDNLSAALNFVVCILAVPFMTVAIILFQLVMNTADIFYQLLLCIPAFTAFTVAASIALRRKGFTKTGFCVQLAGPAVFFVPIVVESVIINFFG